MPQLGLLMSEDRHPPGSDIYIYTYIYIHIIGNKLINLLSLADYYYLLFLLYY